MDLSAQGRQGLIVLLALLLAGTAAFAQSRSEPVDPGSWNERLEIGPVEGFTTVWHKAPRSTAVPLGTSVELRVRTPQSAAVAWSGAREVRRNTGFTVAEARFDQPGPQTVQVEISGLTEEDLVETVHFDVVELGGQPVQVTHLRLTADEVVLDPERPNASSMQYFFRDGSIARLTEDAPGYYVTSTERWVTAAAQVEPAGFAPLLEWRLDGKPLAQLGAQVQLQSFVAREHVLEAGGEELTLETYRVHITSHDYRTRIPDGEPVTFTAVTEPPGYEDRITWLPSTKYGTCSPERGEGAEFGVRFEGTAGALGRWLGVRADGTSVADDPKPVPPTLVIETPGDDESAITFLPPVFGVECECATTPAITAFSCTACNILPSGHCNCTFDSQLRLEAPPIVIADVQASLAGALVTQPLVRREKDSHDHVLIKPYLWLRNDGTRAYSLTAAVLDYDQPPGIFSIPTIETLDDPLILPPSQETFLELRRRTLNGNPDELRIGLILEDALRVEAEVSLQEHESSYGFPAAAEDLNVGEREHWYSSRFHLEADNRTVEFAMDLGVHGFCPGINSPTHLRCDREGDVNKEDYRVWGKPIYAIADGVVVGCSRSHPDLELGNNNSNHNAIAIESSTGERIAYAHQQQDSIDPAICAKGAMVTAGQQLGRVGSSGTSGPHLHIDVQRVSSRGSDSYPLLFEDTWAVDGKDRTKEGSWPWILLDREGIWGDMGIFPGEDKPPW